MASLLFAFMGTIAAQAAESLSVLLQKGIFAEETEGNLDAAIQTYLAIAERHRGHRQP